MKVLLCTCSLLALILCSMGQASLPLDKGFGQNGTSYISFDDTSTLETSVISFDRDKNGNTYVFGKWHNVKTELYEQNPSNLPFICRLNNTGKLDSSFYESGYRTILSQAGLYAGRNGGIILNHDQSALYSFGFGYYHLYSMKFKLDGSNDETYGANGYKKIDFSGLPVGDMFMKDIIVCKDGGFIIIGTRGPSIYSLKIDPDGNMDQQYGTNGICTLHFNYQINYGSVLSLSDSAWVVGLIQLSRGPTSTDSIRMVKISSEGKVDSAYTGNASKDLAVQSFSNEYTNDHLFSNIKQLPDSSIIFFASSERTFFLHQRFTKAGLPDNTYNISSVQSATRVDLITDIKNRQDDHVWLASISDNDYAYAITKIRIKPDGTLDLANRVTFTIGQAFPDWQQIPRSLISIEKDRIFGIRLPYFTGSIETFCITLEGERDTSYHANGFNQILISSSVEALSSIFPQKDGSFIGTATSMNYKTSKSWNDYNYIFKLTKEGRKDLNFGKNGTVRQRDSLDIFGRLPDRKDRLLISGRGYDVFSKWRASLTIDRYTPEGKPDPSFANNGRFIFGPYQEDDGHPAHPWFSTFAVQADNSIIVVGDASDNNSEGYKLAIAKITEDGRFDDSFGDKGISMISLSADFNLQYANIGFVQHVLALKDQSILVVLREQDSDKYQMFRVNQRGKVIPSGGVNGKADLPGNFYYQRFHSMVQAPSGDIIYMNHSGSNANSSTRLMRINPVDLSVTDYSIILDYATTGFKYITPTGIVPLHNGEVLVTGTALLPTGFGESHLQFVIHLTKTLQIKTSFAQNGVMTTLPPVPGTVITKSDDLLALDYMCSGFENTKAVTDEAGNLVLAGAIINNGLKDIYVAKYLMDNQSAVAAPSEISIIATPSDTVCAGAKVMLSIDAAHCQQCSYVWSDGQTTPTIEVDIPGRYTASAYNDGGVEMVSKDIILSPSQKPVLTISFAGCPEKNIHFTAAVDNASIQDLVKWYVNDTLKFQGKSFSFPGVNDMKVHATVRDPSGLCYPETIIYSNTIILGCIANTNSDQDSTLPRKALKISPNPTSHNITFSINTPAAGNYQVELWNATGQIQLRRNIWIDQGSSKHTLPLPSIRSGIYYFKISGRGTQYSQKVSVW